MTQAWKPNHQYNTGDHVEYQGKTYKVIQGHRSQSDWPPAIVPALFQEEDDCDDRDSCHSKNASCCDKNKSQDCGHEHKDQPHPAKSHTNDSQSAPAPPTFSKPINRLPVSQQSPAPASPPSSQNTAKPNQDDDKPWYDVVKDHKAEAAIGGGLLAGVAAIGVGVFHKKKSEDEEQTEETKWNEHKTQKVDIKDHERKSGWHDLSDTRKKEIEIGGGLALGLAAMGAGYVAYRHHEKSEEEKKARLWALQNWVEGAKKRREAFLAEGFRESTVGWVLVDGNNYPEGSIEGGVEGDGQTLYIARAWNDGCVQVGKAGHHINRGAIFGFEQETVELGTYEVLVGDTRAIKWVKASGQLDLESLGAQAIEAGEDVDGSVLYVAQAEVDSVVRCGKISTRTEAARVVVEKEEVVVQEYSVLCYAS